MMKIRIWAIVAVLGLVSGCGVQQAVQNIVVRDLDVAIKRGELVLGPDDALVVCYKALNEVLTAEDQAAELGTGLLLDALMRARIIDQVRQKVEPVLKQACGAITMEVLMTAARRGR